MFAAGKKSVAASNITRNCHRVFTSITNQGGTTPGKLSQKIRKDGTVEGSGGGYGGPEISNTINEAVESSPQGGDPSTDNKGGRRVGEEEDTAKEITEIAKAGVVGAVEVGLKFGEIAKQTMDGMWDVAKKTAEGVRDTVADDPRRGPRGHK